MEKRLTEDLNVVSNSNLEIQLLDGDLNIIQKLDDEPNDVGGLTSAELKAKFDESGNIIKKYINETLIPSVLTDDATEESRKQAEAARVAAEQGRVTAEEGRVSAETTRAQAEAARTSAETTRGNAESQRASAETTRVDNETARNQGETARVAAENARANAETGRSQAEQNRAQSETARDQAETARRNSENIRATSEAGRVQAEQNRVSAEQSRTSAEAARETAEKARADETSGIVARATAQADKAETSATAAKSAQNLAGTSERNASSSAQTAQSAASTASAAAEAASGSASQAQASAAAAAQSAASVDGINKTAQSWAVGGTNTRPGEDTDNAKYWAEQAQAVAGGDFATKVEAQGYVATHNQSADAHSDIRTELGKKANLPKACLVTLKSSSWDAAAKTQTATVDGILADEATQRVLALPAVASAAAYRDAGICMTARENGTVTFSAKTVPSANLKVWVSWESAEDVTPTPTASVAPQSGVNYTAGMSGLKVSDVTAFAEAISNNSSITNATSTVYVDFGSVHRKISVGDQVTLPLNGTNYAFDVIGFNHDALTTPTAYGVVTATGKAGITFQMHDLFGTYFAMNDSQTNAGGWKGSKMRTSTMVTMKGYLPSDWQTAIKPVNKLSGVGSDASSGTEVVSDDCFLLAEGEIFGPGYGYSGSGYSYDDECAKVTQYAYYKAGNSKVKNQNGSAKDWWERSPRSSTRIGFCWVSYYGGASAGNSSDTCGVAFGFCV